MKWWQMFALIVVLGLVHGRFWYGAGRQAGRQQGWEEGAVAMTCSFVAGADKASALHCLDAEPRR